MDATEKLGYRIGGAMKQGDTVDRDAWHHAGNEFRTGVLTALVEHDLYLDFDRSEVVQIEEEV